MTNDELQHLPSRSAERHPDSDLVRLQTRGGSGVINVKTTDRNGKVIAVMAVSEDTEIMVISQQGKIIRVGTSEIREAGRATQGVRLLRTDEGDRVAAASVIPAEAEPEQTNLIQ